MRVDDRAGVRSVCRGLLSPVVKNVDAAGLRIARSAYVMYYSLGTRAHVICTRFLFARSASGAPTIALVLAARQR
jgi:hypothetical protein